MFLSEAEFSICLLCVFTSADYSPWVVVSNTITLKTSAKLSERTKNIILFGLNNLTTKLDSC